MCELPTPFHDADGVTLYHGDASELLPLFGTGSAVVLTDPPYSERTHKNARSNARSAGSDTPIDFRHCDDAELRGWLEQCGRISPSWVVCTLDYANAFTLEQYPPSGLRMMRIGVWVKTNPTPQKTGDRPAQGWESIAYMHRPGRARWNGGGKHGNFVSGVVRGGGHPTVKPAGMFMQFVEWFTSPGDVVLDPFAGSGTTLLAARDLGRRAVGIEQDRGYCELIVERLQQRSLPL